MKNIKRVCLSLFLFILLSFSSGSWALSPYSVLKESTVYEPFEVSLRTALESGFFNDLFKTESKLNVIEVTEVGDSHTYFKLKIVEITKNHVEVEVIYLVEDELGNGIEEKISFKIEGDYRVENLNDLPFDTPDHLKRNLYTKIDKNITDHFFGNVSFTTPLFRNSTKKIIFESADTDDEWTMYYKFGDVVQNEVFMSNLLRNLGFIVPLVFSSHNNQHVWVQAFNTDYPDYEGTETDQIWDLKVDELKPLFEQVGKLQSIMYLFGHDDFHPGNAVISSNQAIPIDFETIGKGAVFDQYTGMTLGQFITVFSHFLHMPKDHFYSSPHYLYSGVLEGIGLIAQQLQPILGEIEKRPDVFASRVLIRPTQLYKDESIVPVPHYTVEVRKEELKMLAIKRFFAMKRDFRWIYFIPDQDHPRFVQVKRAYTDMLKPILDRVVETAI